MRKTRRPLILAAPRWIVQVVARYDIPSQGVKAGQWAAIYTAKNRRDADRDAASWEQDTGQRTRVIRGPGHPRRR